MLLLVKKGEECMGFPANESLPSICRYLLQNMDWLEEELGGYEDEYLIIDCPGRLYVASGCVLPYSLLPHKAKLSSIHITRSSQPLSDI